jgi:hypothetical protein
MADGPFDPETGELIPRDPSVEDLVSLCRELHAQGAKFSSEPGSVPRIIVFSFPRPRQAAAVSEKSRADSRFGRQAWLSSRPHARRTGLLLSAGEEVLVRFIRGDLLYLRFCLERQGTAVATTNGCSAWCGVKLLFGFA